MKKEKEELEAQRKREREEELRRQQEEIALELEMKKNSLIDQWTQERSAPDDEERKVKILKRKQIFLCPDFLKKKQNNQSSRRKRRTENEDEAGGASIDYDDVERNWEEREKKHKRKVVLIQKNQKEC